MSEEEQEQEEETTKLTSTEEELLINQLPKKFINVDLNERKYYERLVSEKKIVPRLDAAGAMWYMKIGDGGDIPAI